MRISGWSSDVCSSDLAGDQPARAPPVADDEAGDIARTNSVHISICTVRQEAVAVPSSEEHQDRRRSGAADVARGPEGQEDAGRRRTRSEEHTSELQSLMRISYAVFCFKTTTKHKTT